jgi:hypothetical protein
MLKLHSIKTVSFGEALLIHANAQAHSIKLKHQAVSAVSFGMTQHWKWAGGANEENCVTQSRHTENKERSACTERFHLLASARAIMASVGRCRLRRLVRRLAVDVQVVANDLNNIFNGVSLVSQGKMFTNFRS